MLERRGPKGLGLALLIGLLALLIGACGGDDDGGGDGDGAAVDEEEAVNVAHFVVLQANPYEQAHIEAARETAEELGGEVTLFDANLDPQTQQGQCRDAITSQQYDAFLLKAVAGPTMVSCAEDAIETGIEVVAIDTPIGPELDTLEPQVEGLAGSVLAIPAEYAEVRAEATADACKGKDPCRVLYMYASPEFTFPAEAREVFRDLIESDYPNIEIVDEGTTQFDPDEGYSQTRQLLQVHDDVDVIVSDADPASFGIWRAMEELGVDEEILLVSDGGVREAVEFIREGKWYASPPNFPRSMARRATEILIAAARGEELEETQVSVKRDLGAEYLGGRLEPEELEDFEPEWELGAQE